MNVRRRGRMAIAVLAVAMFAFPQNASSLPIVSETAQCQEKATVGGGEFSCTKQFLLVDARYPSELESHANFHARMASGTVTVEWWDQLDQLQARFVCTSPGLYVSAATPTGHTVQGGPADLSSYPTCQRYIRNSVYFATGVQTLRVRATLRSCSSPDDTPRCEFHGYLVMNRPSMPV